MPVKKEEKMQQLEIKQPIFTIDRFILPLLLLHVVAKRSELKIAAVDLVSIHSVTLGNGTELKKKTTT